MVVWGGSFIASRIGLDDLYPVELAFLRFIIAAPLLLAITIALQGWRSLIIEKKDLLVLIIMAMTGVTLQYIVQFVGMQHTSVTNTALLINMCTFFVVIPSALFLKERFTIDSIAGIVIAFFGAAFIVTKGDFILQPSILGDGLILICAGMWAVYLLIGNKLAGKYSTLTQLTYIFVIGLIGLIPAYFLTPHHGLMEISGISWACIIYLALICSVIAYYFFNDAIIKIGPSKTAIYQYFEPFFALIFAVLLLGEPLTILTIIGGIMLVAGIAMADNNLKIFGYILNYKNRKVRNGRP
jgi:drug/metabolite transporter (DMT)-like permease